MIIYGKKEILFPPLTIVIPISCGSIMQFLVCSTSAEEDSLMGKEHIESDWEDDYDENP